MKTRDLHVESNRPLLPPAILVEELPLGEAGSQVVARAREDIIRILSGDDDRLPCAAEGGVPSRRALLGWSARRQEEGEVTEVRLSVLRLSRRPRNGEHLL